MSALALSLAVCLAQGQVAWTNTQKVTSLIRTDDGRFFAGTLGGLLERQDDGTWKKQTMADGLPSNEVVGLLWTASGIQVQANNSYAALTVEGWKPVPGSRPLFEPKLSAGIVTAKPYEGLFEGDKPFVPEFPKEALPVSSVAGVKGSLVVGTTNHGLWEIADGTWRHVDFNEPSGNSIVAILQLGESVFVSTLDSGLNEYAGGKWSLVPGLSSSAPRELVKVGDTLWLRHANGTVDRLRDGKWDKNVVKAVLPRKEARFLATDGKRLYVAQWGGWSVLENGQWKHELKRRELGGVATTCLLPDGDRLWIGTQGKGIAVAELGSDKVSWIDERNGMTDDWVTSLARFGEDVFAGTFVGGLLKISRGGVKPIEPTTGENVTCFAESGGLLYVGTRHDLYSYNGYNLTAVKELLPVGQGEVQSLCATDQGIWIGTRTGLYRTKP